MTKGLIAIIFLFLLLSSNSWAQNNNDPCGCDASLQTNFRKELLMIDSARYNEALSIFFSRDFEYWASGNWQTNQDIESGGAYGIISGYFNASESKEARYENFKKDSITFKATRSVSFSTYKYLSQKTPDHIAYTSWAGCKKDCNNFYGILLDYKIANGNEVTLTLTFKQANDRITEKIRDILTSSNLIAAKRQQSLRKRMKIKGTNQYSGKFIWTNISKDASINISVTGNYPTETLIIPSGIDLLPKPNNALLPQIQILNGTISQNADIKANWGNKRNDENFDYHHSEQSVPYVTDAGLGEGPFTEGAYSNTKCIPTIDYDTNSHYKWTLNLTNNFHVNSGLNEVGAWSYAAPYYKTQIKLPQLLPSQSSWNLNIQASSWATNSQDGGILDKDVKIEIVSKNVKKSFSLKTKSEFLPDNFKIDSLEPGEYTLTLQVSKIGLGSTEVPPNKDKSANVQTKLSIEISANKADSTILTPGINPEPKPDKNTSIYYLIAVAALISLGIIIYLFKRKKRVR